MKQFAPVFNENDLINIDNFDAYVKILINGQTSNPLISEDCLRRKMTRRFATNKNYRAVNMVQRRLKNETHKIGGNY